MIGVPFHSRLDWVCIYTFYIRFLASQVKWRVLPAGPDSHHDSKWKVTSCSDGGQTSRCICCGVCCSQVSGYLVDIRKGQVISRHLRTWCGFRMALLTWFKYLCIEGLAANWVTPVRQWCNHNNPKTVWLDVPTADLRKKEGTELVAYNAQDSGIKKKPQKKKVLCTSSAYN